MWPRAAGGLGSLQGRRQPAGLLAGCSACVIFRMEEDLLCAAAATGSGRPGCQMGFSSHCYLRRRRLEVKDVAPLSRQTDLLVMGGASLPQGTKSPVGGEANVANFHGVKNKSSFSTAALGGSGPSQPPHHFPKKVT